MKQYSRIKIKKNGYTGTIIEIDDNGGKDFPVYLVELDEKFYDDPNDAVDWFESEEIEEI